MHDRSLVAFITEPRMIRVGLCRFVCWFPPRITYRFPVSNEPRGAGCFLVTLLEDFRLRAQQVETFLVGYYRLDPVHKDIVIWIVNCSDTHLEHVMSSHDAGVEWKKAFIVTKIFESALYTEQSTNVLQIIIKKCQQHTMILSVKTGNYIFICSSLPVPPRSPFTSLNSSYEHNIPSIFQVLMTVNTLSSLLTHWQ